MSLSRSVESFLDQVAQRGSWVGGGSVAAMSAALAAALMEKLATRRAAVQRLHRIRRACLQLAHRDAALFARVIAATRSGRRSRFVGALKAATDVPYQIFVHAQTIRATCRAEQRLIRPQFHSDLRCVAALAQAAAEASNALVQTNLAWLKDRAYAGRVNARMRKALRPHAT